jgi:lysozyme family protein
MANFEKAMMYTAKYEGMDKYTDDPLDSGGATKYGISINFAEDTDDFELFDMDNDGDIDKEDIKLLTKEVA